MKSLHISLALAAAVSLATPALSDPAPYAFSGGSAQQQVQPQSPQPQYDAQGNYVEPQALGANDEVWQDENGTTHCKRKNGTTGLVIGAVVGGVFGNAIFSGGAKTLGTILGAVGGGLLGRSIEKGDVKCK